MKINNDDLYFLSPTKHKLKETNKNVVTHKKDVSKPIGLILMYNAMTQM